MSSVLMVNYMTVNLLMVSCGKFRALVGCSFVKLPRRRLILSLSCFLLPFLGYILGPAAPMFAAQGFWSEGLTSSRERGWIRNLTLGIRLKGICRVRGQQGLASIWLTVAGLPLYVQGS